MKENLPEKFFISKYALLNGSVCSHICKRNEFTDGIECCTASSVENDFVWGVWVGIAIGTLYATLVFKFIEGSL